MAPADNPASRGSTALHAPDFAVSPRAGGFFAVSFTAMASPCEVLLESADERVAREVGRAAAQEAWRIESKFSRYLPESVVSTINRSAGKAVVVDEETAALIDYAAICHQLSGGLFDITSGVLRRCWKFDGSDQVPEPAAVAHLLPLIGFEKISWQSPRITLPAGMEVDFGGFAKEYAVDRVLALVAARFSAAALVNFGGDLAANRPPAAAPWQVGVERPDSEREARLLLEFSRGGLATSGDTHRFLLRAGVRYGHILNVRTGWPIAHAPRSVTVAASSCVEAGMLATLAALQGEAAEAFLSTQTVRYWCLR
jgi:FAD:protein FMN transferase